MDQAQLVKLGLAGAVLFAAWKWGTPAVKGMALGVAGTVAAKFVPFVKDVV